MRGRVVLLTAIAGLVLAISPRPALNAAGRTPIERALDYLFVRQVAQPLDVTLAGTRVRDFTGDWPQHFSAGTLRVRDVSPFMVAFVHHALADLVEGNRAALGLSPYDLWSARLMRRRAAAFLRAFESPAGAADAGTFAFWPYDTDPATPDPLLTLLLTASLRGPILGGARVPLNLPIYPPTLAIPSDADVTATTYSALLDAAVFDGGAGTPVPFEHFFADWRDVGIVPRRVNPAWMPPVTGAYLTWLTYRDRWFPIFPNDVDLVVNGNVLYALGRYGRLGTPGTRDAVALVNLAARLGLHRNHAEEISQYYPDNLAFQYVVSRAFHDGGVAALAPAVAIFADDLETSVSFRGDGVAYWDFGDPHLNTAFAVLTLLNAGRSGPLVERAIAYLVSQQNARGGFDEATFFVARTDGGQSFRFTSPAFTTAIALEALARHRLATAPHAVAAGMHP